MTKLEEIGKICKNARVNAGLSLNDLVGIMDRPKSRINGIELGRVHMNEYEAKTYSQLFDIPFNTIWHPLQYWTGYGLHEPLTDIKNELQVRALPYRDISKATGIDERRLRQFIVKNARAYATEEEAKTLAKYFGKEDSLFLAYPRNIKICDKNKEEEPTVTLNIKDTKAESTITTKANDTDIWRDKAHELHRQLGEARREIERLKNEGSEKSQEHTTFGFETLSAEHEKLIGEYKSCQNELEEIRGNNKELGRRIENLAIENANLVEENDHLLKDYEAVQNDKKELINRIEEMTKERDEVVAAKTRVVNANAELKMQCNNYKEIVDHLFSEDNDDLQERYDALKAECDKYKELILKVVVKAAELMLEKA